MSCPRQLTLSIYADGELEAAETARLERHLEGCTGCAERVAGLSREADLLRAALEMPPLQAAEGRAGILRMLPSAAATLGLARVATARGDMAELATTAAKQIAQLVNASIEDALERLTTIEREMVEAMLAELPEETRNTITAKAAGKKVLVFLHHGLMEHYTGQTESFADYVIDDWETVSQNLAAAGLKLAFSGHYHANDITQKNGIVIQRLFLMWKPVLF